MRRDGGICLSVYYEQRARFNQLLAEGKGDCEEAAALFYYLNRTGYNGLCRFNRSDVPERVLDYARKKASRFV